MTAKSVHVVLAHLCHQIDAENEAADKEVNHPIFESIVKGLENVGEKGELT